MTNEEVTITLDAVQSSHSIIRFSGQFHCEHIFFFHGCIVIVNIAVMGSGENFIYFKAAIEVSTKFLDFFLHVLI